MEILIVKLFRLKIYNDIMIITELVEVVITPSNLSHYRKFYPSINNKEKISVKVEQLTKFSKSFCIFKCDNCGVENSIMWKHYHQYGYSDGEYLCRTCKMKRNNLEKFGVENVFQLDSVKEKSKQTIKKKFGVDFISQSEKVKNKIRESNIIKWGEDHPMKNKSVLEKTKSTLIKRWGVDNISKNEEIKNKKKQTCNLNFGVDYIFSNPNFIENLKKNNKILWGNDWFLSSPIAKEKIKNTNIEKWGVDNPSKNNLIKIKIKKSLKSTIHCSILKENPEIMNIDSDNRIFSIKCDDCDSIYNITYSLFYKRREKNTTICTICNPVDRHKSGLEVKLLRLIRNNYSGTIMENFKLSGKELDIYVPDLNLAFEFNGVYWYSDIFLEKNYHKTKSDICREKSIQLIHIWEDDWLYKFDILESMIKSKLGKIDKKVYARNCFVKPVEDIKLVKSFLDKNHIQGYVGSTLKLGIFNEKNMMGIMCFKKTKNIWELTRFCSLLNTNVVGGFSKLFKYFLENYSYEKIITFSDNGYSMGKIYSDNSFIKIKELPPDYKYVVDGIRHHKFNFRKKLPKDANRIYDAGKIKWEYI